MEWARVWHEIGATWAGVVGVVIATTVMYLVFAWVLEVWGPRLSATPSALTIAVTTMLGALCARAMLGNTPTMAGALVAVTVLLLLEAVSGRIRGAYRRRHTRGESRRPIVLMVEGRVVEEHLRRRRLSEAQLLARLREVGVLRLADVALVVLETRGGLTVVREGQTVDEALLAGVVGRELVPARLVSASTTGQ